MIGAVLALPACLSACSPSTPVSPVQVTSIEVTCNDFMQLNRITKEVELTAGDSVRLILCSNPSTGFSWPKQAVISDKTIVQQIDDSYWNVETKGDMGAPGKQGWTFKGLKQGKSIVSLEYCRSWEGGEKGVWAYELTLIVK
jgi:inhibitor of cysteine peptidase